MESALLRLRLRQNEIFSNDFPKYEYFRISGILQYHDSSNNSNNICNNVSGKMKSREILKLVLTFFPVVDCVQSAPSWQVTVGRKQR